MKYRDKMLQPPFCLSAHACIVEGKLNILETNQKSEEITHFYHIFCALGDFYYNFVGK